MLVISRHTTNVQANVLVWLPSRKYCNSCSCSCSTRTASCERQPTPVGLQLCRAATVRHAARHQPRPRDQSRAGPPQQTGSHGAGWQTRRRRSRPRRRRRLRPRLQEIRCRAASWQQRLGRRRRRQPCGCAGGGCGGSGRRRACQRRPGCGWRLCGRCAGDHGRPCRPVRCAAPAPACACALLTPPRARRLPPRDALARTCCQACHPG